MNDKFLEKPKMTVDGHVLIRDADTAEVLLDKYNAINFENFALAVAYLLANKTTGGYGYFINKMAFGYGGTVIDVTGNITYKTPKVNGADGGLYSPSPTDVVGVNFEKSIDSFSIINVETQPYTDVVATVVLDYTDPSYAPPTDMATDFEDPTNYVFDELALVTETGDYLTHLIFHPIQKSQNRKLEIVYSLRIRAGI
jgi:hypothetical protein